eukprot:870834_1
MPAELQQETENIDAPNDNANSHNIGLQVGLIIAIISVAIACIVFLFKNIRRISNQSNENSRVSNGEKGEVLGLEQTPRDTEEQGKESSDKHPFVKKEFWHSNDASLVPIFVPAYSEEESYSVHEQYNDGARGIFEVSEPDLFKKIDHSDIE